MKLPNNIIKNEDLLLRQYRAMYERATAKKPDPHEAVFAFDPRHELKVFGGGIVYNKSPKVSLLEGYIQILSIATF